MSNVYKSKRPESNFKVIAQAIQLRKELTTYVMTDFALTGKLERMQEYFLNEERCAILGCLRDMLSCLIMANSIYVTCLGEYELRRQYQDKAIGHCYRVVQELQYVIATLDGKINVNKYMRSARMITAEINLIKSWRKADSKLKTKLK